MARKRKRRSLAAGQVPDPLRAHGAWVYLVVSILAGMLIGTGRGYLPALLVGGGFLGVFVLAGSLAIAGRRAAAARFGLGLAAAIGSVFLALDLGAGVSFLVVSLAAIPPLLAAAWFASRRGFLSAGALSFGVTALVVSAPAVARAGGASWLGAGLLGAILAPFFIWRTWRLARAMGPGWTRGRFERQGLIESALAVAWAVLAVMVIRWLA